MFIENKRHTESEQIRLQNALLYLYDILSAYMKTYDEGLAIREETRIAQETLRQTSPTILTIMGKAYIEKLQKNTCSSDDIETLSMIILKSPISALDPLVLQLFSIGEQLFTSKINNPNIRRAVEITIHLAKERIQPRPQDSRITLLYILIEETKIRFGQKNLIGVSFTGYALPQHINLAQVDFSFVNFRNTDWTDVSLFDVKLDGADWSLANLQNVSIRRCSAGGIFMASTRIQNSKIDRSNMQYAILCNTTMVGDNKITYTDLSEANLVGLHASPHTKFTGVHLGGANILGVTGIKPRNMARVSGLPLKLTDTPIDKNDSSDSDYNSDTGFISGDNDEYLYLHP